MHGLHNLIAYLLNVHDYRAEVCFRERSPAHDQLDKMAAKM